MTPKTYVVVHGGAGVHSKTSEAEVKKALQLACTQTLSSTFPASGSTAPSALELVERAIISLEDSPLLNAGYGSNLTLAGTVECDAALMDGRTGDFGSVGAVSGIRNPICLARLILEHARVPDPLGRIPPLTLVSHGAHAFAEDFSRFFAGNQDGGKFLVAPELLVTPRARKTWEVWKARLEGASSSADEGQDVVDLHAMQDTVGAVAFVSSPTSISNSGSSSNSNSNLPYSIAAGVSSGGILLKHTGRVGEAAVFGAGCWAQAEASRSGDAKRKSRVGMACSVSGTGEYIVRANLARTIAEALDDASPPTTSMAENQGGDETDDEEEEDVDVHSILQRVLAEEFWIPSRSPANPDPSAGVVLLTTEEDGRGETVARLWCAFTTPSMAIAYASSDNPLGKALILRRPKSVESRSNDQPRIFVTGIAL
ncbi:nucleophile aminohydrolase [Mycena galopus ATCC 62051]|nr:nucleophile aminohydrolase [Mycena galopus ATCC 62051]